MTKLILLVFVIFKAALVATSIENEVQFSQNIISINNFLSTITSTAQLQLKFNGHGLFGKTPFSPKTNIWMTPTGLDSSKIKVSLKRPRNADQEVFELNFWWYFESHADKSFCTSLVSSDHTKQKWFLYNSNLFNNLTKSGFDEFTWTTTENVSFISPTVNLMFYHKDGFALILDDLNPWHFRYNKDEYEICFSLETLPILNPKEYFDHSEKYFTIKFKIIMAQNLKIVYQFINKAGYLKRPKSVNATELFTYYLMPASVVFQREINLKVDDDDNPNKLAIDSSKLLKLSNDAHDHNYAHFNFHINQTGLWSSPKDEFTFYSQSFPNLNATLSQIHDFSNQVSLTVNPFIDAESDNYKEMKDHLFKTFDDPDPSVLDLSNTAAFDWYSSKLANLTATTGIDGLFCESGDFISFTNKDAKSILSDEMYQKYPTFITTRLALACASSNVPKIFTTTAYKSQNVPQIVVLNTDDDQDFGSTLPFINGDLADNAELAILFRKILHLSLAGYPFILPRMADPKGGIQPTRPWTLRWFQLTGLLPLMQIPCNVDTKMLYIVRNGLESIIKFRSHMLIPKYIELTEKWIKTGEPIIRPLWYVFPDDPKALDVEDQFMLGDDIMIAPIFNVKENERSIYFPAGKWQQPESMEPNKIFTTKTKASVYVDPHFEIPYFVKIDN